MVTKLNRKSLRALHKKGQESKRAREKERKRETEKENETEREKARDHPGHR